MFDLCDLVVLFGLVALADLDDPGDLADLADLVDLVVLVDLGVELADLAGWRSRSLSLSLFGTWWRGRRGDHAAACFRR